LNPLSSLSEGTVKWLVVGLAVLGLLILVGVFVAFNPMVFYVILAILACAGFLYFGVEAKWAFAVFLTIIALGYVSTTFKLQLKLLSVGASSSMLTVNVDPWVVLAIVALAVALGIAWYRER